MKQIVSELLKIAAKIKTLPLNDMRQTYEYDCGAKALQTVFAYYGLDFSEEDLMNELRTDETGTRSWRIAEYARSQGFSVKIGKTTLKEVKEEVKAGRPVIVLVQAWPEPVKNRPFDDFKEEWEQDWEHGHYVTVIGFEGDKVYFEDPAMVRRGWMTVKEFETRWHDIDAETKEVKDHFAIYLQGKKPVPYKPLHID